MKIREIKYYTYEVQEMELIEERGANPNREGETLAYPIMYDGELNYVFCRAMQDANKNRLYVHEVFLGDKITKGNTLQTAASKPHGGISLYRDILANVLSTHKVTSSSLQPQEINEEITPEQQSLLNGNNPHQYTAERELYTHKNTINSQTSNELNKKIVEAETEVNTNPTEAQKEAGNYKKGRIRPRCCSCDQK